MTIFIFGTLLIFGSIFLVIWILLGAVRARKLAAEYSPMNLAKRALGGAIKKLGLGRVPGLRRLVPRRVVATPGDYRFDVDVDA